jgi:hypothetical protein
MACSTLFRGNNQIAALLGDGEMSIDEALNVIAAWLHGFSIFHHQLTNTVLCDLTDAETKELKKTDEYKTYEKGTTKTTKRFSEIMKSIGESRARAASPVQEYVTQAKKIIDDSVDQCQKLIKRCNTITRKTKTVDYTPAPTVEFPIVCNNEKAPPDVVAWLNAEDENLVDKRVLCDIDTEKLTQFVAVLQKISPSTAKAVDGASQATRTHAFEVGLQLSNGFKVYKIHGKFVCVAKESGERMSVPPPIAAPGIRATMGMMGSFIKYAAVGTVKVASIAATKIGLGFDWIFSRMFSTWSSKKDQWLPIIKSWPVWTALHGLGTGVVLAVGAWTFLYIAFPAIMTLGEMLIVYVSTYVPAIPADKKQALLAICIGGAQPFGNLILRIMNEYLPQQNKAASFIRNVAIFLIGAFSTVMKIYFWYHMIKAVQVLAPEAISSRMSLISGQIAVLSSSIGAYINSVFESTATGPEPSSGGNSSLSANTGNSSSTGPEPSFGGNNSSIASAVNASSTNSDLIPTTNSSDVSTSDGTVQTDVVLKEGSDYSPVARARWADLNSGDLQDQNLLDALTGNGTIDDARKITNNFNNLEKSYLAGKFRSAVYGLPGSTRLRDIDAIAKLTFTVQSKFGTMTIACVSDPPAAKDGMSFCTNSHTITDSMHWNDQLQSTLTPNLVLPEDLQISERKEYVEPEADDFFEDASSLWDGADQTSAFETPPETPVPNDPLPEPLVPNDTSQESEGTLIDPVTTGSVVAGVAGTWLSYNSMKVMSGALART